MCRPDPESEGRYHCVIDGGYGKLKGKPSYSNMATNDETSRRCWAGWTIAWDECSGFSASPGRLDLAMEKIVNKARTSRRPRNGTSGSIGDTVAERLPLQAS